jgi:hypothetical protein
VRELTIEALRALARPGKGKVGHLYLHWTAGRYAANAVDQKDYHLLIDDKGRLYATTDDLTEKKDHTFGRNGNSVAMALCGLWQASPDKQGLPQGTDYPIAATQIETMARAASVLCEEWGLPIDIEHVLTHAEAADNLDGWMVDYSKLPGGKNGQPLGMYGPLHTWERWDLYKLTDCDGKVKGGGDVLRGKANWYRGEAYSH